MKIAIIAYGFSGSTLPLAKHLRKRGHIVTCFYLVDPGTSSLEGIDFDCSYLRPGIHTVKSSFVNQYFVDDELLIYTVVLVRKRQNLGNTILNKIIGKIDHNTIYGLCDRIKKEKYDLINLVGHTHPMELIGKYLLDQKLFYSLHEVMKNHAEAKADANVAASFALKNGIPIIVHSLKSFNDISTFSRKLGNTSFLKLIRFGMFETFQEYRQMGYNPEISDNFLLFIGYILPYKGLSILYDACELLEKERILNFKIVVAGKGYDPILPKLKANKNFILKNKYITNQEFVDLISSCKSVVCPYLSASQSGIPQVASIFSKPVIASNVGAFPEVIRTGKNGILIESANKEELAAAINKIMCDNQYYDNLSPQLLGADESFLYDWNFICNQYEDFFNEIVN